MAAFDETIHQPTRLRIMAAVVTLDVGDEVDFTFLRDRLALSDGNLGSHLLKLEEARYVKVRKAFVGRKPRSFISATTKGRAAFEEHVARLMQIIDGAEAAPDDEDSGITRRSGQ